jgi:tellurite methyltransferase
VSRNDAQRWDLRYQTEFRDSFEVPRPFLVENANLLPASGLALDVAMGLGGNADFLLKHGFHVIGVDISSVAIRRATAHLPGLMPVVADLTHFYLLPASFDLIINFLYLQCDLWPVYQAALKPGGILIFETLTQDMRIIHPEIDPQFLLKAGELATAFPTLQTLVYREGWQESLSKHPRALASLIAQRPI